MNFPVKFGIPELVIILVIIIILFGPGRIGKVAGELGKGIRSFKDGLGAKKDETEEKPESPEEPKDEK